MTERELLYIKTIADVRSFSNASKLLYVSQPSLSQCVSNVEKELGVPLFIRSTKGLTLTDAGECYYNIACEILKIYSDFASEIGEFNELKRGKITLGIPAFLSFNVLPRLLPAFNQQYPGIEIQLVEKNSTDLETLLLSRSLDFAIMHTIPGGCSSSDDSLDYAILATESFVIALPPGDPAGKYSYGLDEHTGLPMLDPGYLKDYPFLNVHRGNRLRLSCDYLLQQAGINPRVLLTTRTYETARRLACAGMGATIIPWEYANLFSIRSEGSYYAFPPNYDSQWNTSIATVKNSYVSKASRTFIDMALKIYSAPRSMRAKSAENGGPQQ